MATRRQTLSAFTGAGGLVLSAERSAWQAKEIEGLERQFFANDGEKDDVHKARHRYPRKAKSVTASGRLGASHGDDAEEAVQRRIMGFGLGFEKIFATTSIKLPVSAYTLFVELHLVHIEKSFSRCFNGLHTVYDLKKWIFEVMEVGIDGYELSYAEPGKAQLTDELRLLTTQDSLDTRTLATSRAAHRFYKGIPGVHSIDDNGVSRLYVRLKCRNCGQLLLTQQKVRCTAPMPKDDHRDAHGPDAPEWCWHCPDSDKSCMYDTRGYEMFCAATAGLTHVNASSLLNTRSTSAIARVYISMEQAPTQKLGLGKSYA